MDRISLLSEGEMFCRSDLVEKKEEKTDPLECMLLDCLGRYLTHIDTLTQTHKDPHRHT